MSPSQNVKLEVENELEYVLCSCIETNLHPDRITHLDIYVIASCSVEACFDHGANTTTESSCL